MTNFEKITISPEELAQALSKGIDPDTDSCVSCIIRDEKFPCWEHMECSDAITEWLKQEAE